ncbi:MAG: contractile injection system tape measure protein [Bacteroidales bacterium]|nr:contractile injection system tape measure protein [Bacteroidales bacterium]
MSDDITIKRVEFDLKVDNEQFAFNLNSNWSSFFQKSFVQIVEEVLEKHNRSDRSIFINSIELNLGEIREDMFYQQFPAVLRTKIEEAVIKALNSNNSSVKAVITDINNVKYNALTFYLMHGYLPWHLAKQYRDITLLLKDTLRYKAADLKIFLIKNGHIISLKGRLVMQLTDMQLENIVSIVEPTESTFIIGYFRFVLSNYKHVKSSEKRRENYRNATWHVIISYLLQNRGTYFNKRDFVRSTVRSLSAKYNIKYSEMLRYLSTGIIWFSRRYSGITELVQILSDITTQETDIRLGFSDNRITNKRKPDIKNTKRIVNSESIVLKIYKQITGKNSIDNRENSITIDQLNNIISDINADERNSKEAELTPEHIKEYLAKRVNNKTSAVAIRYLIIKQLLNAEKRKRLLNLLTEDEIIKLTLIVEPEQGTFIVSYAKTLDNDNNEGLLQGETGREFHTLKWEFIFLTLFQNRGSQFNRKAFAISVLIKISAHYNLSFANVIEYIYRGINNGEISTDITNLIKEIYQEWKKRSDNKITSEKSALSYIATDVKSTLILFRNSIRGVYSANEIATDIREIVIKILLRPVWRKEFITALNNIEFKKLTALVEPEEYEFVTAYSDALDKDKNAPTLQGKTGSGFRELKWEFIFIALLEDRGTAFNRKSFMLSVLTKISGHYNLTLSVLVEHLYKSVVELKSAIYNNISNILKEISITLKEKRTTTTGYLNNSVKDDTYADKLYQFITLGYISTTDKKDNIYDIFNYLRTHKPKILTKVLIRLQSGFVLTDFNKIDNHKQLYRELILFVISEYNLNLPGGKRVQNLFGNISADRYGMVPIITFKIMLAACLQNRVDWYNMAWDSLTQSERANTIYPHLFESVPDSMLVQFIFRAASDNNLTVIKKYRNTLFSRVFASEQLYRQFAISLRTQRELKQIFISVANQYILQLMSDKFHLLGFSKEISEIVMLISVHNRLNKTTEVQKNTEAICYLITTLQYADEKTSLNGFMNLITGHLDKESDVRRWTEEIKSVAEKSSITDKTETLLNNLLYKPYSDTKGTEECASDLKTVVTETLRFRFRKDSAYKSSGIHILEEEHLQELLTRVVKQDKKYLTTLVNNDIIDNTRFTNWLEDSSVETKRLCIDAGSTAYYNAFTDDMIRVDKLIHQLINELKINKIPDQFTYNMLLHYLYGKYRNTSRYNFIQSYITELFNSSDDNSRSYFKDRLIQKLRRDRGEAVTIMLSVIDKKTDYIKTKDVTEQKNTTDEIYNIEDGIPVENAGVVLVASYLPRLFSILKLTENGNFTGDEARIRAAMLIQYIVLGTDTFPEHQLVLNKILTGIDISDALPNGFDITETEENTINQMIKGIIQHWSALKNTSVDGFRESFMKREGILYSNDKGWNLTVEQRGYDVLIDRLPWSFVTTRHKWMNNTLFVKWR